VSVADSTNDTKVEWWRKLTMALGEGEVGTGTGSIDYASVTSCLAITCLLEDGTTVGGHLSLFKASGALASNEVLPAMKELIGGRTVKKIVIAGELDTWNPAYFDLPLFDDQGQPNYQGEQQAYDVSGSVGSRLGALDALTELVPRNGTFTITPTL
jgi:hypothetical protein